MQWEEEDWEHLLPEGPGQFNNPPSQSTPAVQQPLSNDDQTAFIGVQYGAKQDPVPAALLGDTYAAQEPQGQRAFTLNIDALPEAEYWYPQNPGPLNVRPVPNVVHMKDEQYVELRTLTTSANAVLPITCHGIITHSPGKNTARTFGEQKAHNIKEEKVAHEPYIKKPPNAFMQFLKENRASAEAELGVRMSTVVNKHLAERWKSLSPEEKELYYAEAKVGAILHSIKNPSWTNKINYGKKRKRCRRKATHNHDASAMFVTPPQQPSDWAQ